ncbi:hypothetical protein BGW37DRAFT_268054 [Umbelopsis sp. PMI_123]|nr:hypothetical protein BGW37DRAFT_268054 [Umbelopsis sp. PMI_123]
MENTSKRRDSLQNQRPEQSIADEDTSVSHPLRVQQQNQSDRQGDVAIESYGGVSPTMSYEKDQPRFNRAIDPQYKFREIYANAQSKPQSKTRKPPEKQYSWIERMNHSVEKVQDKDKGGDANDGLVDKFIDFLNGLGEQPEESHPKDAGYIAQQHGVEFEPSEATYDTAQANNATRGDDTTQDEPTMLASRSSGPISSYKTADMSEFDMSDGQYDNFQQTERLDDNARRNSWSKPSGK